MFFEIFIFEILHDDGFDIIFYNVEKLSIISLEIILSFSFNLLQLYTTYFRGNTL